MNLKCFRFLCCLFLTVLLGMGLALPAGAQSASARPLVYTALGDSIASGYKLSQSSQGYVSLYGASLSAKTTNLAKAGLDSKGLLKMLTSDQKVIKQVKQSDIVTVSIGGNDLLPIFSRLQPTSPSGMLAAVQAIGSARMQQTFQKAVRQFGTNWDQITARIHKLAPHAQVIATTLIDPYQGLVISLPVVHFDLGDYANRYISQIDTVITGHAKSGNYAVADSYRLFLQHKSEKLTNANLSKLDFDPHPNATGHHLIFQAHQSVPLTFTQDALELDGPADLIIQVGHADASTLFTSKPLLTCFTANGISTQTVYSVEDAGKTGAYIDTATGKLVAQAPGAVQIKATLSAPAAGWTAETTRTIQVFRAIPPQVQKRNHILLIVLVFVLVAAVVLAILLLRRRKRA